MRSNNERLEATVIPTRLYHYTSVETFGLMLRHNTIRFRRLDLVNDPDEGQTHDLPASASAVFVSCWTDDANESLPLWTLYAGSMEGVRVGLPTDFLAGQYVQSGDFALAPVTRLASCVLFKRHGFVDTTRFVWGPHRVSYTDDSAVLHPQAHSQDQEWFRYELLKAGLAKRSYWAFEREWRYRVFAAPEDLFYRPDADSVDRIRVKDYFDFINNAVETQYVDISLGRGILSEAEVIVGPKASPGVWRHLEALFSQYGCQTSLVASEIMIR